MISTVHKLIKQGYGKHLWGKCSCGQYAWLGTDAPEKGRRQLLRTKFNEHVALFEKNHPNRVIPWTQKNGKWKGYGYCWYCNSESPEGGDFCGWHCSNLYAEDIVIPTRRPTHPLYTHDCNKCEYLGSYENYLDLYICIRGERNIDKSLIARYGNKPHEYLSSLPPESFAGDPESHYQQADPWYRVLIGRAQEKNLI